MEAEEKVEGGEVEEDEEEEEAPFPVLELDNVTLDTNPSLNTKPVGNIPCLGCRKEEGKPVSSMTRV